MFLLYKSMSLKGVPISDPTFFNLNLLTPRMFYAKYQCIQAVVHAKMILKDFCYINLY